MVKGKRNAIQPYQKVRSRKRTHVNFYLLLCLSVQGNAMTSNSSKVAIMLGDLMMKTDMKRNINNFF